MYHENKYLKKEIQETGPDQDTNNKINKKR